MRFTSLVLFTFLAVSSAAPVSVTRDDLEVRAGLPASQILGFNKANGLNQAAQKGANAPLTSLANLAKTAITTLLSPGPKLGRAELEEVQDMLRRGIESEMELEARAGVPASQILGFNKANGLNQAAQKGANAPLTSLANLAKTAITTLLSPGPKLGRSELEELEARAGVPASQILSFNKANGLNQAAQKGANAPLTSLANLAKTAITTLLSPGPKLGRSELEEIHSILSRGLEEMEHEARAGVPASQILGFNKANGLNQAAQKGANAPLTSLANLAKTAITTLLSPGPKLGRAELEEVQDMLRRGMEAAVNELD